MQWLREFGTDEQPKIRLYYDYAAFDPEDDLFGEYDGVPHRLGSGRGRSRFNPPGEDRD